MNNIDRKDLAGEIDKKPGYKETKLGWIPEEWEASQLKMHSKIDANNLSSKTAEDYTFRYISLSDINNGVINNQLETFKFENAPSRARRIVKKEDVLLATVRPNLKAFGIILEDSNNLVASTGFAVISAKARLSSKFLFYYLFSQKMESQLYSLVVGSNYPAINSSDVRNLNIVLPPLPEQQKIAAILSTWDETIELIQRLIEAKEEQKKGLMQRLLTGKVRVEGYSEDWGKTKLKDIAKRVTRKNEELNDNVVTISAQRGFVKQEEYFTKRVASSILLNYYLVDHGDFCYNKSYSNGYPMGAFKRLDDYEKAVVTTLYICFRLKLDKVSSDFILNYFEGGNMVHGLMKIAQEGGRAHGLLNIGLKDFFDLEMTLPKKDEQIAIATILTKADKEIDLLNQKLESIKEQKKGLMQVLLTGKIRVGYK